MLKRVFQRTAFNTSFNKGLIQIIGNQVNNIACAFVQMEKYIFNWTVLCYYKPL